MKEKSTAPLTSVLIALLSIMCVWLAIENENLNKQLDEEIAIKYEYSVVIDSLMTEREIELEGMRHWNEELEKEYIQANK